MPHQFEGDFGSAAVSRHRQQQRFFAKMRRELAPTCRQRAVIIAIGAVDQCCSGRARRRIVSIKGGLRRIVAGIEKTVADFEMKPDAARRMAVASGFEPDAENFGRATDWQRTGFDAARQALRHDLGGIDRWIAELGKKRKAADMILVAVAEDQCIGWRRQSDVRHASWRRTLAEIEHQAFASRLNGEAGRALFADPGNEPQRWAILIHESSASGSLAPRARKIDKPAQHP